MKAIPALILLLVASTFAAIAPGQGDRETYNRRAAEADLGAFRALDLDRNGSLTRDEALPDLNFGPRFNDMDIDRDGVVTVAELRRYLEAAYGAVLTGDNQLVMKLDPPSGR